MKPLELNQLEDLYTGPLLADPNRLSFSGQCEVSKKSLPILLLLKKTRLKSQLFRVCIVFEGNINPYCDAVDYMCLGAGPSTDCSKTFLIILFEGTPDHLK